MSRTTLVLSSLVLAVGITQAQTRPAPAPKAPSAPRAPAPIVSPYVGDLVDLSDLDIDLGDLEQRIELEIEPALANLDIQLGSMNLEPMLAGVTADAFDALALAGFDQEAMKVRVNDAESAEYSRGTAALDKGRYDDAVQAFDKAIAANGKRADGAMYWKAYSLNRLGRGPEALATLEALLKNYPSSRWANDARALQVEVRQASGRPVNPAQESDEELKLLALNGLVRQDPDRGLPLVEQILASSASPRTKEKALFILTQSGSPRARTLLVDIAKGKGNPDLQMKALDYLGVFGGADVALLVDIYKGAPDVEVKKRVIRSLALSSRRGRGFSFVMPPIPPVPPVPPVPAIAGEGLSKQDVERIQAEAERAAEKAQAEMTREFARMARESERMRANAERDSERNTERDKARQAKAKEASDALWQLYQAETSVDLKREILRNLTLGDQPERLAQVARTEKEPSLRRAAIQSMIFDRTPKTAETLAGLYRDEKDPAVKRQIVNVLAAQDTAGPLVQIARQETDPQLRRMIVERLSSMKDKEATDYLMELIKK